MFYYYYINAHEGHSTRIFMYLQQKNQYTIILNRIVDEKTDYYSPTTAWKKKKGKNIEQFLFSKLTPRHHGHGTEPRTHSKQHTVSGQITQTKQDTALYYHDTTYIEIIGFETRSSVRGDNHTSQRAQLLYGAIIIYISIYIQYTPYAQSNINAYNITKKFYGIYKKKKRGKFQRD